MYSLFKESTVKALENKLNIDFNNKLLLQQALIHKSYGNERKKLDLGNNERMEFLGDAVLNLSITDFLFKNFNDYSEGELAKIKAVVVSEEVLNQKAQKLNIGKYILLGKGEEMTGGRNRKSILADTMEAIIGAIYLDKDFAYIKKFIQKNFAENINEIAENEHVGDFKTILQEIIQQKNNRPDYEVFKERGPEHNKTFSVQVKVNKKVLGTGQGDTKKEAEQEAARAALENLNEI